MRAVAFLSCSLGVFLLAQACGSGVTGGAGGTGANTGTGGTAGAGGSAGTGGNAGSGGSGGCSNPSVTPPAGVVMTDKGQVRGQLVGSTYAYRGIPYAQPPVGDQRWRAPESVGCWTGIRDAFTYGSICVQHGTTGWVVGDEDCLTLNIWTPSAAPPGTLPVMVYIHGGSNLIGSGSFYPGRNLSEAQNVVVVTLNYRLGAFGFLAHSSFAQDSPSGSAGNYALLDQLAVLRWVQQNIAAFGGDPSKVLLFGQSAGAFNTCALLASPLSAGLFSRVLMQSGPCLALRPPEATAFAGYVVTHLGCNTATNVAACLRGKTPIEIAGVPGGGALLTPAACNVIPSVGSLGRCSFNPVVDGHVLNDVPLEVIRAGAHNAVPFVIGTTADEYSIMNPTPVANDTAYQVTLSVLFGATQGAAVAAAYPSTSFTSANDAMIAVWGDWFMLCPARRTLRAFAAAQAPSLWQYLWSHVFADASLAAYGASHAFEIPFVFVDFNGVITATPTAAELILADDISGYWARFAAAGDPNGAGAFDWTAYDTTTETYLDMDVVSNLGTGLGGARCDTMDAVHAALDVGP